MANSEAAKMAMNDAAISSAKTAASETAEDMVWMAGRAILAFKTAKLFAAESGDSETASRAQSGLRFICSAMVDAYNGSVETAARAAMAAAETAGFALG